MARTKRLPVIGFQTAEQPTKRLPTKRETNANPATRSEAYSELASPSERHQTTSPSLSPIHVDARQTANAAEEEAQALLRRIQDGIEYQRIQALRGDFIKQTTRFEVATTPSPVLTLLRRHGTLISASDTLEVYELGIPRPDWVQEGILPGVHDPQWWVRKSQAEIKAGPFAEEADAKRAEATLKGQQTKKNKKTEPTAREREIDWKLKEGLRRQQRGLPMCDDEVTEDESDADEGDSDDSMSITQTGRGDNNSNSDSDGESDGSEDQPLVKRGGGRRANPSRKRSRLEVEGEEKEDEESQYPRRDLKPTGTNPPRKRVRRVVDETDSDDERPKSLSVRRKTPDTRRKRAQQVVDETDSEEEPPRKRKTRHRATKAPERSNALVVDENQSKDETKRRNPKRMATNTPKRYTPPVVIESENEEDMPKSLRSKRTAAKAPKSSRLPVVHEVEGGGELRKRRNPKRVAAKAPKRYAPLAVIESESEDDMPLSLIARRRILQTRGKPAQPEPERKDELPKKRNQKRIAAEMPKRHAPPIMHKSESEGEVTASLSARREVTQTQREDLPTRRNPRRMASEGPQKYVISVVHESESENEDEKDTTNSRAGVRFDARGTRGRKRG